MHDRVRGRKGAFDRTRAHLENLVGQRDRHRLKVRMSFTVMRNNVAALPDVAALAQEIEVRLYLNSVGVHEATTHLSRLLEQGCPGPFFTNPSRESRSTRSSASVP